MSSLLQSPFMEDGIREVVPNVAKVAGSLAASSVIQGRRRVRLVPQSGQNYQVQGAGGANTINFLIQDGQSYADLLSAVLSFEVTVYDTANANGTTISLDDGAFSVFRRALVSVNSTLMDDIDLLPKKVLQELYPTVDQSWYDNVGSWMGLWKMNCGQYGQTTPGATNTRASFVGKYDVGIKQAAFAANVQGSQAGDPPAGRQNKFAIPVCMLSSFFRNEMLYPLRNAGQLYLQINLNDAISACVAYRADANAVSPAFKISNLTMELDFCDLHPSYISMMDEVMEDPSSSGVRWPFDAHLVSAQNMQATAAGQSTEQSVIVSKASQNLRAISVGIQPQTGLSLTSYPKNSTWANGGFSSIQYRIGSLYYPAFASIGEHRAYFDLQNAYGSPASLDKSGVIDTDNYYLTTSPAASIKDGQTQAYADCWLHAYCFDRLKHARLDGVDLDGVNTLTTSGSQIVVQLNTGSALAGVAPVMTAVLRFTRVLEVKGGATRVIG